MTMDKKSLSERDILTKFLTPAIVLAGWDIQTQVREGVTFTAGRIKVQGQQPCCRRRNTVSNRLWQDA